MSNFFAGMSGLGDAFSESEAQIELDKAKAIQLQARNFYAKAKPELVAVQITTLDHQFKTLAADVKRAEIQFTAEKEKPWYSDSDYDQSHANAQKAQTHAARMLADMQAFLRYNSDERVRLGEMEKQRLRSIQLSNQVPAEEVKAAQGGLVSFTSYQAAKAGKIIGQATRELAEGVGAGLAGVLKGIPWWVWGIGVGGVGLYFFGPALAGKAIAARRRA